MAKHDGKKDSFVVWQGYEYEHREKTRDWYSVLGIISAALAGSALFFGNYLFAVLIIVAAISIGIHAAEKPELKEFRVDSHGIKIGRNLYAYQNINSFFIDEASSPRQLFFELKRPFVPLIIVPLNTARVETLKEILSENLTEKEHEVPVSQKIFEYFGF